ncbi:hypothetical protein ASG49_13795 [Marmoricola sp. Leaf446]|uniref:hypothetical protein n=1 Tax=Marmoricola sp. Leaf446 TaxID=1736379 RepID=UPI0006F50223|nr:hypothetical protein [Marmoricola sp. Leaf446]KQT90808.1 hypothetical protein ASG49_13795 [Marmoricola sp. Leaf446]
MDSPRVSWALATWVVPAVPVVWFLGFGLLGSTTTLTDREAGGYATALGLALGIAVVGAALTRLRAPSLGLGLVAGGLACSVPSLWVLLA